MARTQTMVQLTEDLVDQLDRRARREGRSRSQLIREAVEAYLVADREREIDAAIIDGYARMPQGDDYDADEWGDLGRLVTGLGARMLEDIADEDRAAGFAPW